MKSQEFAAKFLKDYFESKENEKFEYYCALYSLYHFVTESGKVIDKPSDYLLLIKESKKIQTKLRQLANSFLRYGDGSFANVLCASFLIESLHVANKDLNKPILASRKMTLKKLEAQNRPIAYIYEKFKVQGKISREKLAEALKTQVVSDFKKILGIKKDLKFKEEELLYNKFLNYLKNKRKQSFKIQKIKIIKNLKKQMVMHP